MPKIFEDGDTVIINTTVVVSGGGSVTNEEMRYDLPEVHPVPTDLNTAVAHVDETHPVLTEAGILGVLLTANETYWTPKDAVSIASEIQELHAAGIDSASIVASIAESHALPNDSITVLATIMDEVYPVPLEDVSGTEAQVQVNESEIAATHTTDIVAALQELHAVPPGLNTIGSHVDEIHPVLTEDLSSTLAIFSINESDPLLVDAAELGATLSEAIAKATDEGQISIDVSYLWPNAVVSNDTWANTAGMTDKNTGTAATLDATSSGIGGTTSNSTTGTAVFSLPDMNLGDLNITSIVLDWSITAGVTSGTQNPLSPGSATVNYDYSSDNGANWTTFFAQSSNNSTSSLDITSALGAGTVTYTSPVYQSGEVASNGGGQTSIAITKPSGLSVGDLLVAGIWNAAPSSTTSAPAGWTEVTLDNSANGRTAYYKVADSSDVASTSFTFTRSLGGTYNFSGGVFRITGFDSSNPVSSATNTPNTASNATTINVASGSAANTTSLLLNQVFANTSTATLSGPGGSMTQETPGISGSTLVQGVGSESVASGTLGTRTWTSDTATTLAAIALVINPDPATGVSSGGATPAQIRDAINQFQVRGTGTVVSGQGTLGAVTYSASWYWARLRILGSKTYY